MSMFLPQSSPLLLYYLSRNRFRTLILSRVGLEAERGMGAEYVLCRPVILFLAGDELAYMALRSLSLLGYRGCYAD